jgi:DNA-binding NtrC family response regulator
VLITAYGTIGDAIEAWAGGAALGERESLVDLFGRAPAIQRVYRQIERVAATDATVLCLEKFGITTA